MSALSTCPEELLADIFSYGAAAGPFDYYEGEIMSPNTDRILATFRVAAVCRRWRSIALSYPRLWHYIAFPSFPLSDRTVQYAQLMLERSGDTPIDIVFLFIEGCLDEGHPLELLLNALAEHRSRWRRFAAQLWEPQIVTCILDLFTGVALPTLRKLQISIQNFPTEQTFYISPRWIPTITVPARPFLQYTPCLTNVATINCSEFWKRWQPVHSQHKVIKLELLQQDLPDDLWDLLATQVELKWLTLGAGTFDAQRFPRPPAEPIDLPKMRKLWLEQEAPKIFKAYPQVLRMPTLDHLVLFPTSLPPLAPWFETLRPQLVFLHLRAPSDFTSEDIAVIGTLHNLKTFELVRGKQQMPTLLLDRLCEHGREDDTGVMWPWLIRLKLLGVLFDETSGALLMKLIRMRRQPAPVDTKGLPRWTKLLYLRLSDPAEQGLTAQLEEFKRLGKTADVS